VKILGQSYEVLNSDSGSGSLAKIRARVCHARVDPAQLNLLSDHTRARVRAGRGVRLSLPSDTVGHLAAQAGAVRVPSESGSSKNPNLHYPTGPAEFRELRSGTLRHRRAVSITTSVASPREGDPPGTLDHPLASSACFFKSDAQLGTIDCQGSSCQSFCRSSKTALIHIRASLQMETPILKYFQKTSE